MDPDPVTILFTTLPWPHWLEKSTPENQAMATLFDTSMQVFLLNSKRSESKDADSPYLIKHAEKAQDKAKPALYFHTQLAILAASKKDIDGDGPKAQQLRYYRWVARGRKTYDWPLDLGDKPTDADEVSTSESLSYLADFVVDKHECACCGQEGAILKCSACLVRHGSKVVVATYYCNAECQLNDLEEHKPYCNDMICLDRATSLFQEIFMYYLNVANSRLLLSSSDEDGMNVVKYDNRDAMAFQGKFILQPFADENCDTVELASETLVNKESHTVMELCRPLFELFFREMCQPFVTAIEHMVFYPKNMHRPILSTRLADIKLLAKIQSLNSVGRHDAFCITMRSGLQMMFDPTGGQFGWKDYLTRRDTYMEHRVHRLVSLEDVPAEEEDVTYQQFLKNLKVVPTGMYWRPKPAVNRMKWVLSEYMCEALKKVFVETANAAEVDNIIDIDRDEFAQARETAIDFAGEMLRSKFEKYWHSGKYRLYYDPMLRMCTTECERDSSTMDDGVYFTEEEYTHLRGNRRRLQKLWADRFQLRYDRMEKLEQKHVLNAALKKATMVLERKEQQEKEEKAEQKIQPAQQAEQDP